VDISVIVFCVSVCMVTDFSAEEKASGIIFYMVVHRRPRLGMSHFGELCSPRSPKPACELASARSLACRPMLTDVKVTFYL